MKLVTNDSGKNKMYESYYYFWPPGLSAGTTLGQLKRSSHLQRPLAAIALLAVILAGCSGHRLGPHVESAACKELAKTVADQEQAFIAHVRAIRAQHILIQDYDRQMIAAITDRRAALQATKLTEVSVTEEIAGCSGQSLDDLRHRAQEEMVTLGAFLRDFNRALKSDPQGVYIDGL
jgi:hypothetical protein